VDDGLTPSFIIVEGQSPKAWRDKLWDLAKAEKFEPIQNWTKKPEKWMTVYSVKADFVVGEEEEPDIETAAQKVWKRIKTEMGRLDFRKAADAVTKHLQNLPDSKPRSESPL